MRFQPVERDFDGMAGTQLLGLQHARDVEACDFAFELPIDDDQNLLDAGATQRANHVPKHRPAADLVQHLGACALHARPFTCGQNDGTNHAVTVCRLSSASASRSRSRTRSRPSSSIES